MKQIELRPIKESTADYDRMEARIKAAYKRLLYVPLLKELGFAPYSIKETIANAKKPPLILALESGRITYTDGAFQGQFDSYTTKELKKLGAKWKKGKFYLDEPPMEIRAAVSTANARVAERLARIDKTLQRIDPAKIAESIKTADLFDSSLVKVDREVKKSAKGIAVFPELTDSERKKISDEWQTNMDKWISNFTKEEILRLREEIQKSTFSGNRYESITKAVQRSYGVTQNKAKFLARQETSLLMTKFKESRYTSAGITEYKWACVAGSKFHPVRPSHKILDGKIFKWQDPPITTAADQPVRRNNPGEDYNCRCFAKPIVKF